MSMVTFCVQKENETDSYWNTINCAQCIQRATIYGPNVTSKMNFFELILSCRPICFPFLTFYFPNTSTPKYIGYMQFYMTFFIQYTKLHVIRTFKYILFVHFVNHNYNVYNVHVHCKLCRLSNAFCVKCAYERRLYFKWSKIIEWDNTHVSSINAIGFESKRQQRSQMDDINRLRISVSTIHLRLMIMNKKWWFWLFWWK